jgi:hypothetical protein
MRNPVIPGVRSFPMAADPHVSSANPIPVAAEPYVADRRRRAVDFDLRRRRSHVDRAADINHRGAGNCNGAANDAAAEQSRRGQGREQ